MKVKLSEKEKAMVLFVTSKLTTKEKEILSLLSQGFTSKEIGKKLGNKSSTIDTYRNKMLSKFPMRNITHLACYCVRNKIIK